MSRKVRFGTYSINWNTQKVIHSSAVEPFDLEFTVKMFKSDFQWKASCITAQNTMFFSLCYCIKGQQTLYNGQRNQDMDWLFLLICKALWEAVNAWNVWALAILCLSSTSTDGHVVSSNLPRVFSNIWKKIWGRHFIKSINHPTEYHKSVPSIHDSQQCFVMAPLQQQAECSIILYQHSRRNRAAHWEGMQISCSCEEPRDKKLHSSHLKYSIISIRSFHPSGVYENTKCNTHTCCHAGRWHLCLHLCLSEHAALSKGVLGTQM